MESPVEMVVGVTVEVFIVAAALGVLYRIWGKVFAVPQRHNVLAFQQGVVLRGGHVERVVGPGHHWMTPKQTLLLCDMRTKPFQVQGQEALTQDGIGIRMSFGCECRIADPSTFVIGSSDAFGACYLELRQAIRAAVGEMSAEAILSGKALFSARVSELLVPKCSQLGIEMTQLEIWEAVPVGWARDG
ncbi:SPFH domain-containing protein [Tunturiibacter gelidiferens]|uniref:SPFH domain-containing protein n=1 Tax=Tunturiibacter gelidiferens TaxID=3069689 RepID=UPI003D9BE5AA